MTTSRLWLILVSWLLVSCTADSNGSRLQNKQSAAGFEHAIDNSSTSPSYVKIDLVSSASTVTTTCVTANLLLGAIHRELGLPFTDEGRKRARSFAIRSGHQFRFRRPEALANLPSNPTSDELMAASRLVAEMSGSEIRESLRGEVQDGSLLEFYNHGDRQSERAAAVACALIDRGFEPRMADMTGFVYIPR